MDMFKIGEFIAECRKDKKLTQMDLAKKLYVTDRAISKWERGKSMPDSSIMLELCNVLGISVNELLTGEKIDKNDYDKQAESNLIKITKQKEGSDKRLLNAEILLLVVSSLFLITSLIVCGLNEMPVWAKVLFIVLAFIVFLVNAVFCIIIEQKAGYYECAKCHHRYIPTFNQSLWSMHMGRTKYLKCPHCGKKSWNKKVISEKK